MMPRLQPVAVLPLTASGRVDRTALRLPARSSGAVGGAANRDRRHRGEDLVGNPRVERVGLHDDFFELGTLARGTQLISRLP